MANSEIVDYLVGARTAMLARKISTRRLCFYCDVNPELKWCIWPLQVLNREIKEPGVVKAECVDRSEAPHQPMQAPPKQNQLPQKQTDAIPAPVATPAKPHTGYTLNV